VFHPGVQFWALLKLIDSGSLTLYALHVLLCSAGFEGDTGKIFLDRALKYP
jgi:hypothetical protein